MAHLQAARLSGGRSGRLPPSHDRLFRCVSAPLLPRRPRGSKGFVRTRATTPSSAIARVASSKRAASGGKVGAALTLTEPQVAEVPSLRELRQAIPKDCFEPDTRESLKYAAVDLAWMFGCFAASPFVAEHPILTLPYAAVTGLAMWSVFVVGHDCGHGSFSKSNVLNGVVGHICHAPLMVPFYPWAYSHKQHHRFHNHRTKDMSHPWMKAEEYKETNAVVRALALDHWIGLYLGFPGYLLMEPEWSSTDGSHFWPWSRLFDRAPKNERLKCAVSSASCIAFLAGTFAFAGGPVNWAIEYGAPYLVFSWWLFTVTYLQHHDHDTETFEEGEWEYVLGGAETIDREFGLGIDKVTHNITDCHVAHHMFTDMPHYKLERATEAVRGVLEPRGLYKRRDTRDFVRKVFTLHEENGHCIDASADGSRPRATRAELEALLPNNLVLTSDEKRQ